jgi:hypothetical protein
MIDNRTIFLWLLGSAFTLLTSSVGRADGGTLRVREKVGEYQIAIFTSPTPLRAGPVDVSVLVQDASTGVYLPESRATVRLTSRVDPALALEYPATAEGATNKLFLAAQFDLPRPGAWDVEVRIEGPRGTAVVRCEMEADEPLPRWLEVWPWIAWPAAVVVLFGVHQLLVRRKAREGLG